MNTYSWQTEYARASCRRVHKVHGVQPVFVTPIAFLRTQEGRYFLCCENPWRAFNSSGFSHLLTRRSSWTRATMLLLHLSWNLKPNEIPHNPSGTCICVFLRWELWFPRLLQNLWACKNRIPAGQTLQQWWTYLPVGHPWSEVLSCRHAPASIGAYDYKSFAWKFLYRTCYSYVLDAKLSKYSRIPKFFSGKYSKIPKFSWVRRCVTQIVLHDKNAWGQTRCEVIQLC